MNTKLLLESIAKHITLTEEETRYYLSLLKQRQVRKRQFLFQEGDVCKYTSFVTKGCMRSYAIDKNGTEHVFQFAVEGWWVSDMDSFKNQSPSMMNVDALEDSEILMLSKQDMDTLFQKVPKYEHFTRNLLENAFIAHQQRILQNICYTATERYEYFRRAYPFLEQRLPQTQIASYLGVTPEFFSKMKSRVYREK